MRKNSFGLYGITQYSGKYDHSFNPDQEAKPLFRAIFWSIVAVVVICVFLGWMI